MTKRKITRKSNRPLTDNPLRYYSWGGDLLNNLKNAFSGSNIANTLTEGLVTGVATGLSNTAGNLIGGGLNSNVGNALNNVPIAGGLLGGIANRMFGSKINQENVNRIEDENTIMNSLMIDDSSNDSIENQWLNQNFGEDFTQSDIGEDGWFSNKAKNKYRELKKQQSIARNRALTAFDNAVNSADTNTDFNAMLNFKADGGPLFMRYSGTMSPFGNRYDKGGKIHIKPENRGKFTALKKRTGKSASWFKEHGTPAQKKMAVFALNARKWKHAFGGDLLTHGAEWDNGLKMIGNGGTHEENPMEGVPMGIAPDGQSNLVEEGEVIFNDYVFSNRMTADKDLLEAFNLPKSYDGYSFAAIAERLGKESEERPNDPISRRGLMSSMSRLQQAQETIRQKNQAGQEGIQYAHGGRMGILFDGPGDSPNLLDGGDYSGWQDYGTLLEPINAEDLWNETIVGESGGDTTDKSSRMTWLRYAPVVGATIGLGQNLFSKPDYTSADAILEAADKAGNYTPIEYSPIGNYLTYKPFDRNYYINKLNAQAGATRRAILNTTSPSRNAALLVADYNALGRLGDLARQAEEYNLAQRQAVETFNRGTNMTNSEMGLKAAMANQEAALKARSSRLSGVAQAMAMRDAIDNRRSASMSANLTNLFDSLGNIGIDAYNRADRDMLIKSGVFGTLSQKPQEWSNKRWEDYKKALNGTGYSKGGKLKKRRGGLTY